MTGMIVCGPWTMTFDIHDHRHRLKQLRDSGDTKLFANRDEMAYSSALDTEHCDELPRP